MLTNDNFRIRQVEEEDLSELTQLNNDLDVRGEYLPCDLVSPQETRQQFNENGMSTDNMETLLIVSKDDKLLGTLWHFKSVPYFNAREIGYKLFDVKQRGKGFVSEAVTLLTSYLFSSLQINRLEIRMDINNLASEKVATKCGYKKEGTSFGASYVRGRHVDMHIYAMLREEWQASNQVT